MHDKLNKPPIIEAWIGLQIERSPETPPWGILTANQLLKKYLLEMPRVAVESGRTVRVAEKEGELPEVVDAEIVLNSVRLLTEAEDRCIQLMEDKFVFNILTTGVDYPGFDSLLCEATPKFEDYLEFSRPRGVTSAAMCYNDLVRIPIGSSSTFNLQDYFHFVIDTPEDPFGPMTSFSVQSEFKSPDDEGPLRMVLHSIPSSADSSHAEFLMQWTKECQGLQTLDFAVVSKRLQASRAYIRECFRASVTEKTWTLFEPQATID